MNHFSNESLGPRMAGRAQGSRPAAGVGATSKRRRSDYLGIDNIRYRCINRCQRIYIYFLLLLPPLITSSLIPRTTSPKLSLPSSPGAASFTFSTTSLPRLIFPVLATSFMNHRASA